MDATTVAVIAASAAVLSALAAMISAGVAAWSAHLQREASKPQVHVALTTKIPIGIYGVPEQTMLVIDVMNRGGYPVIVDGVGFALRDKRTAPILSPRDITGTRGLPCPLAPGEAISIPSDIREMARIHVTEGAVDHAYATTAGGGRYKSGPVTGNWLSSWAKPTRESPDD